MTKRKRGRPKLQPAGASRVTLTLDAVTISRARKIGSGNLSLGIRLAVSSAGNAGTSDGIA